MRPLALCALLVFSAAGRAQAPSYAKDVQPFFAKFCLECHNAKALKGGLSLETYKGLLEGSDKGPVFKAGNPEESPLVLSVEGKTKPAMPPKSAKYHPEPRETALLRAWVKAGAKDDGQLIKVVIPDIRPRQATVAPVPSVAYGGDMLAFGKGKTLQLLNLKTDELTSQPQTGIVTALTIDPKRALVAIALGRSGDSSSVVIIGLGMARAKTGSFAKLHRDAILDMAFSPDGKYLATASYDTQIKLTPLTGSAPERTLKEHSDAVYAVAFSPDGQQLASCGADRAVKVWDVASAKLLYTLGDANDWLYTLAWSPDGKYLAAGGVDKSIRIYQTGPNGAKIVHSVFAHEAPVQKVVYSEDGGTLYSLGQDQIVKAWDAGKMVERKTYQKLPETGLCLAVQDGQIAVGRYDGTVQIMDAATGRTLRGIGTSNVRGDLQPGGSPGTGPMVSLPLTVEGKLEKAGAVHFYRFQAAKGQQLGVRFEAMDKKAKFDPFLEVADTNDKTLAEARDGFLGYTFTQASVYAVRLRDRDFRGGANMGYRLTLGEVPIVTALYPLGVQRGTEAVIGVTGVFLDSDQVRVKAPSAAEPGSKITLALMSTKGKPLGRTDIIVGEYPEVAAPGSMKAAINVLPVPGTANGRILESGQADTWKFTARKGQRLVLETNARRLGSALDSVIEVLDMQGNAVPRALLRCQAKTYVTFRDHDSAQAGIRIEAWNELATNDLMYVGSELMKIAALPTHPDADCFFFSAGGQRSGLLDTTPTHHSQNEPMYKVTLHPPGTVFPPNGYPVFTLFYRNDDGGPGYGRDSRIMFDPPADGAYLLRVTDARAQGGGTYGYRLTVRQPRPSFTVRFSPTRPVVARGGALSVRIVADRIDGYDGPIDVRFEKLPPGFSVPPTIIEAGQSSTDVAIYAEDDAKSPAPAWPLRLIGSAKIEGDVVRKEAMGEGPTALDAGDLVAYTEESAIHVEPGRQVKLTVHIERRQGFLGRVPLEVRGLPHGVRVLDLGLNGILVNENEVRRTIVIQAEPWVQPTARPFVVLAKREGKNTEHAAKAVMLEVGNATPP